MTHLLTQSCTIKSNPNFDKFGNPNVRGTNETIMCRIVEGKKYVKDKNLRDVAIDAMLTTVKQPSINDRVEYGSKSYSVYSSSAMTSPDGVIGWYSQLQEYSTNI